MFVKNGTGVLKRVLLSKPQYLKAAPINEIARKWAPELDVEKMLREPPEVLVVDFLELENRHLRIIIEMREQFRLHPLAGLAPGCQSSAVSADMEDLSTYVVFRYVS